MDPLAAPLKRLREADERLKSAEDEWERLSLGARLVFHQGEHEPFAVGALLSSVPQQYSFSTERTLAAALRFENQPERVIIPERGDLLLTLLYANNSEKRLLHTFSIEWDQLRRKRGSKKTGWIPVLVDGVIFNLERTAPDIYRFGQPPFAPSYTGLARSVSDLVAAFRTSGTVGHRSGSGYETIAQAVAFLQGNLSYSAERLEVAASAFKQPRK